MRLSALATRKPVRVTECVPRRSRPTGQLHDPLPDLGFVPPQVAADDHQRAARLLGQNCATGQGQDEGGRDDERELERPVKRPVHHQHLKPEDDGEMDLQEHQTSTSEQEVEHASLANKTIYTQMKDKEY